MTRLGFDSNILTYLAGGSAGEADQIKVDRTRALYAALLDEQEFVAPVQTFGESYRVLTAKFRFPPALVAQTLVEWETSFEVAPTTVTTMRDAATLAAEHRLQIWDAVIICAAAEAECSILLSEDMQHGFVWQGLTIIDPFVDPPHPRLAALL